MKLPLNIFLFRMALLVALGSAPFFHTLAQGNIDSLETLAEQLHGLEKLKVLHQIIPFYLHNQDDRQALRYARQAERLTEDILRQDNRLLNPEDFRLKTTTYFLLGQAYQQRGQYMESKAAYNNALWEARQLEENEDFRQQVELALQQLDSIGAIAGKPKKKFLGKLLDDLSETIDNTTRDFSVDAALKLAELYEENGNMEKAISHYTTAANRLKDMGDWEQEGVVREHLADLLAARGQLEEARANYEQIREATIRLADSAAIAEIETKIEAVNQNAGKNAPPGKQSADFPVIPKLNFENMEIGEVEENLVDIRQHAENAERVRDYQRSLDYYKQYLALEQQLTDEKRLQELALLEQAHEIENRDREILLLKQNDEINQLQLEQQEAALQRQEVSKRNLFLVLGLLCVLGVSLFLLYYNKRRDHHKLGLAYQNLATAQNRLKTAEQRVKSLLDQHVSGAVANELLAAKGESRVERRFVCIMFLDIRDFTPFAEKLKPEEIIEYQNKVFGFMIDTINKHGGIVNQIMGDGFMATFGAPASAGNDCLEAYLAAREILETLELKSREGEIPGTRIGIGLHAGYVVTGNVGTESRKQYSVTGNPVIIASRLEQLNKDFGSSLIISKDVHDQLPEAVRTPVKFTDVTVKGRSTPVAVAIFREVPPVVGVVR